jgi:Histidine kinase
LPLVTIGLATLTVISVLLEWRERNHAAGSRLAGAMGLFLFAISFLHFGSEHASGPWSQEVALHHAGLPLALLVLLQGYRFLLLDAFLRFIVNASLTATALLLSIRVAQAPQLTELLQHPFDAGVLLVSACLLLALFIYIRNRLQSFLTQVIFLRSNVDEGLRELQQLARATTGETDYLTNAAETIARFLHASRFELTGKPSPDGAAPTTPIAVLDSARWNVPAWAMAVFPLRFSRGDARYLLFGPRDGGRRYLSEDFGVLGQFGAAVIEHVEQLRGVQMQSTVSQAELRTLQAQINPHFLFNSLNTLYGTIHRSNPEARRLVLNLADVFRYLLRSDRRMEQVPRVGKQVELPHTLSVARNMLSVHHVSEGTDLHACVEDRPGVGFSMAFSQQTRPVEEGRALLRTTNGSQVREVILKSCGYSDHEQESGREACGQHKNQRANFLRARNRELSPRHGQAAHPIDVTGLAHRAKVISDQRANSGNERTWPSSGTVSVPDTVLRSAVAGRNSSRSWIAFRPRPTVSSSSASAMSTKNTITSAVKTSRMARAAASAMVIESSMVMRWEKMSARASR